MSMMGNIQSWSDKELVKQLRNQMREGLSETNLLLIMEALARLLEKQ
jgi:hypothetical protein